ncbi:MAG: DNA alkylation repair protein, partial [Candidatus Bathyarchaeota archaeon]|nr:DNA alkylation repair protein [Candidatus Bathyarchaeota archaeon]
KKWVRSESPWVRRAAAVTFIYGLRRRVFLDHIFEVADTFLTDQHKYVQWGYGWMLKEATKHYQGEVFEYVMRKKAVMPRPALRYAIEKMPTELKAEAMKK